MADFTTDTSPADLRVFAVDDHELLVQSLAGLFETEPGLTAVGVAHSLTEARSLLPQVQPDVVVLDQRLPDGNGIAALRELQELVPGAAFVVLTANPGGAEVRAATAAGAVGVVAKTSGISELVETIRHAGRGQRVLAPDVLAEAMQAPSQRSPLEPDVAPSPEEMQVLRLLAAGHTNDRIAEELGVGVSTVRTLVASLAEKLGARSKLAVLARALELGLVSRDGCGPADSAPPGQRDSAERTSRSR